MIKFKGSEISTGGKASGFEPLKRCHENIVKIFEGTPKEKELRPIDCHDIMCLIADSVLSGGIRKPSLISLFSLGDKEMVKCKSDKISYGKEKGYLKK